MYRHRDTGAATASFRKARPYSRKKFVTKMIKGTLLGYLTAIFSVRGPYLSLISFVPLIAIWDIYWESLKNEDWFCFRGDLLERPKKIYQSLKGVHTAKARVNETHTGDVLLLKDHIKLITAMSFFGWNNRNGRKWSSRNECSHSCSTTMGWCKGLMKK